MLLLLFAISYSQTSFFILFGLFLLIAINEFCNLVQISKTIPSIFALLLFSVFTFGKIEINWLSKLVLAATILISIKAMFFLFSNTITSHSATDKYLYIIGYIIFSFIFIAKIPIGIKGYNPKIIIGIFILIWTNDSFAYIVGKSIGKNKLFERVSPKKTIEGFIGGLVFSIFVGILISKYYIGSSKINTMYIWIGIAFIASVFGTIGDLVESKFKRIANVKDSGNIMPGHGGVLDRLDSIIFVAPFIYLFYQILYYVS